VVDLEIDCQREVRDLHEALRKPARRHLAHAIERDEFVAVGCVDAIVEDGRFDQAGDAAARSGRLFCCTAFWRVQDVGLNDATVGAGALEREQVNAFLPGEAFGEGGCPQSRSAGLLPGTWLRNDSRRGLR